MAGKNTAAFGIYRTQAEVEYAVDLLRAEGSRNTDISVLFPRNAVRIAKGAGSRIGVWNS